MMKHVRRLILALFWPTVIMVGLHWPTFVAVLQGFFPPHSPSSVVALAQAADQQADNTLVIPAGNVTAPLIPSATDPLVTTDWSIIRRDLFHGVSLSQAWAQPGQPGTVMVIGHSSDWTPHRYSAIFAGLYHLPLNTEVDLKYHGQLYRYRFASKELVSPTDRAFFDALKNDQSKSQLALVTCWPLLTTAQRLVVIAQPLP